MKAKKKKKKPSKPKIEIDFKQLDSLLELHLRKEDIATFFKTSEDTLSRFIDYHFNSTFAEYKAQKGLKGRILLLSKYWDKVREGNMSAIIFGLKNLMDWSDRTIVRSDEVTEFINGFTTKKPKDYQG